MLNCSTQNIDININTPNFAKEAFSYNAKIIKYPTNYIDVIKYNDRKYRFFGSTEADRTRNWSIVDGFLVKNRDTANFVNLRYNLIRSCQRAKDTIFNLALSNSWRYFVTLTFSPEVVERSDCHAVKYLWKKYRQSLQLQFPDIRILTIPEFHKDGKCLHFHILLGNCDLSSLLTPAVHNGEYLYTKRGQQVYNLDNYKYGFSTVIETDGSYKSISYYLTKYVSKNMGAMPYNARKYYSTRNLDRREVEYEAIHCSTQDFLNNLYDDNYDCQLSFDVEYIDKDIYTVFSISPINIIDSYSHIYSQNTTFANS